MKILSKSTHLLTIFLVIILTISCKNQKSGNAKSILKKQYHLGISAHRGNSKIAPENTLASFKKVLEIGVDYIEIDVRTSKDGQLVILHDHTLNRTTTGKGALEDFTLAELKTLSAGKGFSKEFQDEKIPTLDETLEVIQKWNTKHKNKTNFYVDCKDVQPKPLIKALSLHNLLNNAVFYGSDEFLFSLKNIYPKAKIMPSLDAPNEVNDKIKQLKPYAFDVRWTILNASLVKEIHAHQIKVFSDILGILDTPTNYKKATELGIDVVQTDNVSKIYDTLLKAN